MGLFSSKPKPPEKAFIMSVVGLKRELKHCSLGDYVNMWAPRDNPHDKVFIYRKGSIGGYGKIGMVPEDFSGRIALHLYKGLKIDTKIISLGEDSFEVECRLINAEEQHLRDAEAEAKRAERENVKRAKELAWNEKHPELRGVHNVK